MTQPKQDCQGEACAIQTCLSQHNYNESKCTSYVDALYKCCDAMYAQAGDSGKDLKSTACPVKEVVQRRMKKMDRER